MVFEIYGWGRDEMALGMWIDDWMQNHDYQYWEDVGTIYDEGGIFIWEWADMTDHGAWVMEDLVKDYGRQGVEVERVN